MSTTEESTRITESRCTACGHVLNAASNADAADPTLRPRPDDFSLCIQCGTVHRFNADFTLRKASAAEIDALDAESAESVQRATKIIRARNYESTAEATFEVVGRYKAHMLKGDMPAPLFQFPAEEIALIGSLADIGKNLVRNRAAHDLLTELLAVGGPVDCPTAMMLRTALEMHKIIWLKVPLAELGLKVGTT